MRRDRDGPAIINKRAPRLHDPRVGACRDALISCPAPSSPLSGAELSRLSLLASMAFCGCELTGARFDVADLREADPGGLKLSNAKQFAGATISTRQAAELVRGLGLNVV